MKERILMVVAAALVLVTAVLVTQLQQPPSPSSEPAAPLTDVAGAAPVARVRPEEAPSQQRGLPPPQRPSEPPPGSPSGTQDTRAPVPEAPAARAVAPSLMPDPARPPQWTQPLALPSKPTPPDPFVPPPIQVDPERGRPSPAE